MKRAHEGAKSEKWEPTAAVFAPARCKSLPVRHKACRTSSCLWLSRDTEAWEKRVCCGDKVAMGPVGASGGGRNVGTTACFGRDFGYECIRGTDKSSYEPDNALLNPNRIPSANRSLNVFPFVSHNGMNTYRCMQERIREASTS
jgi:hypothetical protein